MLWLAQFYHRVICKIASPFPCCFLPENAPQLAEICIYFPLMWPGLGGGRDLCPLITNGYNVLCYALMQLPKCSPLLFPRGNEFDSLLPGGERARKPWHILPLNSGTGLDLPSWWGGKEATLWKNLDVDLGKSVWIRSPVPSSFFVRYRSKNDTTKFPKTVLPVWLQKSFRMIAPWPAVELMCQTLPPGGTAGRGRTELNSGVASGGRSWGAPSNVTGLRSDVVLLTEHWAVPVHFQKTCGKVTAVILRVYLPFTKPPVSTLSLIISHTALKGKSFHCLLWKP